MTTLVVNSQQDLMVLDAEGRESLDLMRIAKEGDMTNITLTESECPGVMEETAEYSFITLEGGIENYRTIEITRILDSVTERKVSNTGQPWIVGLIRIR